MAARKTKKFYSKNLSWYVVVVVFSIIILVGGVGAILVRDWRIKSLANELFGTSRYEQDLINSVKREYLASKEDEAQFRSYKPHNQCSKYGYSDKSQYLNVYKVRSGDTLLSIAANELGDVSAVNQISLLNKDRYPQLSLVHPFIEVGWQLYLPPDYINEFFGGLWEMNAELAGISEETGKWYFYFGPESFGNILPTKDTLYPNGDDLSSGDCIKYIYDTGAPAKIFKIASQ